MSNESEQAKIQEDDEIENQLVFSIASLLVYYVQDFFYHFNVINSSLYALYTMLPLFYIEFFFPFRLMFTRRKSVLLLPRLFTLILALLHQPLTSKSFCKHKQK